MSKMMKVLVLALISFAAAEWKPEMENPGMFEGDIVLDPDEKEATFGKWNGKGNAYASIKGGRWPSGRIPYTIESSIDSKGRRAIQEAIAEYHRYTCLRFSWRGWEKAYLSFYSGGGCSSPVGYRKDRMNRVSIRNGGCSTKGIVIHEIGHSIGLYHEQSRPDRDNYVYILWNNISPGSRFNFNKQGYTNINSLGTPYDYESIMHYGTKAFGGNKMTIQTRDHRWQYKIGQRETFSKIDIQQINRMYCNGRTDRIAPPPPPPPRPCTDNNQYCKSWADGDQCRANKGWMEENCRKSCRVC